MNKFLKDEYSILIALSICGTAIIIFIGLIAWGAWRQIQDRKRQNEILKRYDPTWFYYKETKKK